MAAVQALSTSHGQQETDQLRKNLEQQMSRLLVQLQDCEDMREDLDEDEYEDIRTDTLAQIQDFEASLSKMAVGGMSLSDDIDTMRMAMVKAVKGAFTPSQIVAQFAKRRPQELRDMMTTRISVDQRVQLLSALKALKETLTPEEEALLKSHSGQPANSSGGFTEVSSELELRACGSETSENVVVPGEGGAALLTVAGEEVKSAQQ